MKRWLMMVGMLLCIPQLLWAAEITVGVKGMVCAFCAQGIEKKFKGNPAVVSVVVDLKKKVVQLTTRPGQTLDEAVIRKVVVDAGYAVESIEVQP